MRTIRFIAPLMAFLMLLFSAASSNAGNSGDPKAVHPNVFASGLNKPCPDGSDKMFVATLKLAKGQIITAYGPMNLVLKDDTVLTDDEGYRLNKRKVEFYFFPESSDARVKLRDLRGTMTYAVYTGASYSLQLRAQCNEHFGG